MPFFKNGNKEFFEDLELSNEEENEKSELFDDEIVVNSDEISSEIEEIIKPSINFSGGFNFDGIKTRQIEVVNGNLLIKGGLLYGLHGLMKRQQGGKFEFVELDDKKIDIGNFEIKKATIIREDSHFRKNCGKVEIHIEEGKIFDNDGDNSIKIGDPLYGAKFKGVLKKVKGGYEGELEYWTEDENGEPDPHYLEAIEGMNDNEIWEVSSAKIFFKEANILVGKEIYSNDEFVYGVTSKKPKILKKFLNKLRKEQIPLLKKGAELTKDHKLKTEFETDGKYSKKEIFSAIVTTIILTTTINTYKSQILGTLTNRYLNKELPTLNFSDENHIEGSLKIESGEGVGIAIKRYMKENQISGNFNNLWGDLKKFGIGQVNKGKIINFTLKEIENGKWTIVEIK